MSTGTPDAVAVELQLSSVRSYKVLRLQLTDGQGLLIWVNKADCHIHELHW